MGSVASRRNAGVEEVDMVSNNAYRYPPKSGNYFANHFIMGGERFDTIQPEMYLFGENTDLNFLGCRPAPFPYPLTQSNEPSRTLKSLINIRKDSLRFVRVQDCESDPKSDPKKSPPKEDTRYNIEFTFDSDVPCAITIHYFASEDFSNGALTYHSRDLTMTSDTFHYKQGANQTFSQTSHVIDPSKYAEDDWLYHSDRDMLPLVVHCVVEDEEQRTHAQPHSHATFGVVEYNSDVLSYSLKPLKQKQAVDGLCYLIQEIYGIENKNNERSKMEHEDEYEDNSSECVICMCEMRDTLILPCRHLCLCSCCANNLRYQANNCPICRAPFRALLQIRTLRKKNAQSAFVQNEEDIPPTHEGIPQGYESTSLMEALNGPLHPLPTPPQPTTPAAAAQSATLHQAEAGMPVAVRPTLLSSNSSSPEVAKQRKLVKPPQSISDMSLRDSNVVPTEVTVAVTKETDMVTSSDDDKQLSPCQLLTPDVDDTEPRDETSSSLDNTDFKACSDLSAGDSDETRSESLSMSIPSVEIINELNNARKLGRLGDGCRQKVATLGGSPRYGRRPHSDLGLAYVSEDDVEDSLSSAATDPTMHRGHHHHHRDRRFGSPKPPSLALMGDKKARSLDHEEELTDDRMALPGTPSNNDSGGSSGSSFGSTSSSKMLIREDAAPPSSQSQSDGEADDVNQDIYGSG